MLQKDKINVLFLFYCISGFMCINAAIYFIAAFILFYCIRNDTVSSGARTSANYDNPSG